LRPAPRSTIVLISLYARSSSSSWVGRKVRIDRIVRSVLSVSAKNESSPVGLGDREEVRITVHFRSLIKAAAQGIEDNSAIRASSIVYFQFQQVRIRISQCLAKTCWRKSGVTEMPRLEALRSVDIVSAFDERLAFVNTSRAIQNRATTVTWQLSTAQDFMVVKAHYYAYEVLLGSISSKSSRPSSECKTSYSRASTIRQRHATT
jgi:hypothetical protein